MDDFETEAIRKEIHEHVDRFVDDITTVAKEVNMELTRLRAREAEARVVIGNLLGVIEGNELKGIGSVKVAEAWLRGEVKA